MNKVDYDVSKEHWKVWNVDSVEWSHETDLNHTLTVEGKKEKQFCCAKHIQSSLFCVLAIN